MGRPPRSDGLRTRNQIIDAAVELIASGGIPAATQRKVAARAGVSLASTTYHFPAASDLIAAALDRAALRYMERLAVLRDEALAHRKSFVDACLTSMRDEHGTVVPYAFVTYELLLAAVRDPALRPRAASLIEALQTFTAPWVGADRAAGGAAAALGLVLFELASPDRGRTATTITETFRLFGLDAAVTLDPLSDS